VSDPISPFLWTPFLCTKRSIGEAAKAHQLELQLISRKQATHHNRAEISVMTLANRVIASPILMQRIGDPSAHIHRLRPRAANAINARNLPS
jgi:hypothetical protein